MHFAEFYIWAALAAFRDRGVESGAVCAEFFSRIVV
jgi:hypothetical protein